MQLRFRPVLLLASLCGLPAAPAADTQQAWTDSGANFSAGTLGNAGQNLHVNRRGELETIRRYDLDGNGHLDLFTNTGHDMYYALPATMVKAGGGAVQASDFNVDGSTIVAPFDLNRDGYVDLVFMPNRSNVQNSHRGSLRIAWGGPDGWTTARLSRQLPVNGGYSAEDKGIPVNRIAIGDMNGDGWPDLMTLNSERWLVSQPPGKILRTYWGGPDGFELLNFQDLGIADAVDVVAGGFGAKREFCAAVLTATGEVHYLTPAGKGAGLKVGRTVKLSAAGPGPVTPQCAAAQAGASGAGDILWIGTNSPVVYRVAGGAGEGDVKSFPAAPATHLALGRLDDDPWPDLVLTDLKVLYHAALHRTDLPPSVTVFWGDASGIDPAARAPLSIPNAIATAVGDLNGDGHGDLAAGVFQGETSMRASSRIYLGNGTRQLPAASQAVATEGCTGVGFARVAPDAAPVAVFANSLAFTLDSMGPLRLFWGVPGGFSPKEMVEIPNLGGLKSSAADLNADGYVDLIFVNGGDIDDDTLARNPDVGANIYWGGPEGTIKGPGPTRFDPARRTVLHEPYLCSINVADLNGDGFLDLVLGAYERVDKANTQLAIYYGSAEGFLPANRKVIEVPSRSLGCLIADFNRDGFLDISVVGYVADHVYTYWGGPDGFKSDRRQALPCPAAIDLEAADLNGDGWLDLIASSYIDFNTERRDVGLSIFWGGPGGWKQSNSQWLPGLTSHGIGVADLDGDGFLDIVTPNYHGEMTREHLPSYIYWGSAHGYAPLQRTSLTVDSGLDVMIADLDGDGRLDLAFTAHSVDAGHRGDTPIYFNDGHRFAAPRVQYLPVLGPFYSWVQDLGNIYHRRFEENFTSRAFTWNESGSGGRLTVDAKTAFGAHVGVQVRSAASAAGLASAPWRKVEGEAFTVSPSDRALQYRLDFLSVNGDAYPIVRKVDVKLK